MTARRFPESSTSGCQWIRSVEVAAYSGLSPQYIQYRPSTLVATSRSPTRLTTIEADFDQLSRNFPPCARANAFPCLVQVRRSREAATPILATFERAFESRFHMVYVSTYVPSSASTTLGSSQPPNHS